MRFKTVISEKGGVTVIVIQKLGTVKIQELRKTIPQKVDAKVDEVSGFDEEIPLKTSLFSSTDFRQGLPTHTT